MGRENTDNSLSEKFLDYIMHKKEIIDKNSIINLLYKGFLNN